MVAGKHLIEGKIDNRLLEGRITLVLGKLFEKERDNG